MDTPTAARLLETGWLRDLEQRAGVDDGWSRRVRQRVEAAQAELGDSWQQRTVLDLLDEVRQEVEDIGGWAGFARLKLRQTAPTTYTYHEVMAWLEEAIHHAILADRAIGRATAVLRQ